MTITTKLSTLLTGKLIGKDEFGNKYYESKSPDKYGKKKRWVQYKGLGEPSKVPPKWHLWLHYTTDSQLGDSYDWQKQHMPNLTGTKSAYFPPGDERSEGSRDKVSGDFEAWNPNRNSE